MCRHKVNTYNDNTQLAPLQQAYTYIAAGTQLPVLYNNAAARRLLSAALRRPQLYILPRNSFTTAAVCPSSSPSGNTSSSSCSAAALLLLIWRHGQRQHAALQQYTLSGTSAASRCSCWPAPAASACL